MCAKLQVRCSAAEAADKSGIRRRLVPSGKRPFVYVRLFLDDLAGKQSQRAARSGGTGSGSFCIPETFRRARLGIGRWRDWAKLQKASKEIQVKPEMANVNAMIVFH